MTLAMKGYERPTALARVDPDVRLSAPQRGSGAGPGPSNLSWGRAAAAGCVWLCHRSVLGEQWPVSGTTVRSLCGKPQLPRVGLKGKVSALSP